MHPDLKTQERLTLELKAVYARLTDTHRRLLDQEEEFCRLRAWTAVCFPLALIQIAHIILWCLEHGSGK